MAIASGYGDDRQCDGVGPSCACATDTDHLCAPLQRVSLVVWWQEVMGSPLDDDRSREITASAMRQIAERDARINLLLAMASWTKADAARIEAELRSLKCQAAELQSSASWRITAPLRYVAKVFRPGEQ
jgi:hypothetical protein